VIFSFHFIRLPRLRATVLLWYITDTLEKVLFFNVHVCVVIDTINDNHLSSMQADLQHNIFFGDGGVSLSSTSRKSDEQYSSAVLLAFLRAL